LLGEGQFTATYKYALLLAIADICVEEGKDSAAPFEISTQKIAEKFIGYYWPHVHPYAGKILRQNTGNPPAVISALNQMATRGLDLSELRRDRAEWIRLLRKVDRVVCEMPLWKLQTVGNRPFDFLYKNVGQGLSIQLRPGVMFCLRRFYELVTELVRGAWIRYVRRFNSDVLGAASDLDQFLFGSERAPLDKYLPILREVQEARCLYCGREVPEGSAHLDHFIPWSRYPLDLGHNLVFAHNDCNLSKAEHLAALAHLQRWTLRNRSAGDYLREQFDARHIVHNAGSSERIARWAYSQAAAVSGPAWLRKKEFQRVDESYLHLFSDSGSVL
jgi:hypothetical protein